MKVISSSSHLNLTSASVNVSKRNPPPVLHPSNITNTHVTVAPRRTLTPQLVARAVPREGQPDLSLGPSEEVLAPVPVYHRVSQTVQVVEYRRCYVQGGGQFYLGLKKPGDVSEQD